MLPPKLDYLFVAEFSDGTRYFQDKRDCSQLEPLTRSAFYDVLQRITEVKKFSLIGGGHEHTVYLEDGHFVTDGQIISSPYGPLTNYRLIYFRRVQQVLEGGQVTRPQIIGYFLGWQANDEHGRNQQMTLEIPPLGLGSPAKRAR